MVFIGVDQAICYKFRIWCKTTKERLPCVLKAIDNVSCAFLHMAISLLQRVVEVSLLLRWNFLKHLCKQLPERFGGCYFETLARCVGAQKRRSKAYHIEVRIFA